MSNPEPHPAPSPAVRSVLLLCWRDTAHPQGGGSERYLERIGAELAAAGVAVTLRTARYRGAPRREVRDGMVFSRGGGQLSVYPRALGALLAARWGWGPLADARPDVVVDTQNGVPFFARVVAGVPVTVLVHHCHRAQWPVAGALLGRLGWFIESRLSPRLHRHQQYVTVSQPSADDLVALGVSRERVAIVRAGADAVVADTEVAQQSTRLIVLSRLVPHKQIEHALKVVATLGAAATLDIVGSGWWEPQLRAETTRLGIADRVRFHGHVDEQTKHRLLARSSVHLMPSRTEGWGLAAVEAAQHGVPTIGYRSSRGLTDSVVSGETGFLVDDFAELVGATATLLDDPELARKLGAAAQRAAATYSWSGTAAAFARVLHHTHRGERVSGVISQPGATT